VTGPAAGDDPLLRIRMPRQVLLGIGAAAVGTVPLAFVSPWLALLWLLPVLGLVAALRSGVDADRAGLTVRGPLSSRVLGWDDIRGLRIRRNAIRAVGTDGAQVRLPVVRPRHLPLLAAASGGRLPDPTAPAAGAQ
jgi:hypothetical protein